MTEENEQRSDRISLKNQDVITLSKVNGDVEIRSCGRWVPEEGNEIVVTGTVTIQGALEIEGNLRVGSLKARTRDTIEVFGDLAAERSVRVEKGALYVEGWINAREVRADSSLSVGKDLTCSTGSGGGSVKVGGNAIAERISGGGSVKIEGNAEVKELRAGGSVKVLGEIQCDELKVGGSGKVNYGKIGTVSIGGSFKSEGAVEVEEIDVGGSVVVGPGSFVKAIDVGGSFKSTGEVTFGAIDVGGSVKLGGAAKGETIDVGGSVYVAGPLELMEDLEVGGKITVDGDLKCHKKIKIGGVITVDGRIDTYRIIVGGRIEAKYVKAEGFRLGGRGEVTCPVESKEILVRERARTESLYGDEIRVEDRSRVKSIYGRDIYIERGTIVEGEIQYTESLEMEEKVTIKEEPKKVDSLPPPEDVL